MAERPSIFPSITPDNEEEPFVDNTYNESELENLDGRELQSLAADHPTDEVNGRSSADDIREALVGKERI